MPCSLEFVINDLLVSRACECITVVKHMSNLTDVCGIVLPAEELWYNSEEKRKNFGRKVLNLLFVK